MENKIDEKIKNYIVRAIDIFKVLIKTRPELHFPEVIEIAKMIQKEEQFNGGDLIGSKNDISTGSHKASVKFTEV